MRKWFKTEKYIQNGNVKIYYDAIEYKRGKIIVHMGDKIIAELKGDEVICNTNE